MDILQMVGISFGITAGSRLAEWIWKKNRASVQDGLNSLDEKLESKTGEWPIELHLIYDGLVKKIVQGLDYAANPVVFRRVERFLLGIADPSKRAALLAELYQYVVGKAKEKLSDELKAIINTETKDEAIQQVGAKANLTLPPEFVAVRDFPADIEDAVVVIRSEKPEITAETIAEKVSALPMRSPEMQALIEGLREKNAKK